MIAFTSGSRATRVLRLTCAARSARRCLAFALGVGFGGAGCGSAQPESFYVLASGLRAPRAAPASQPSILVTPAALPDLVDRPQLVISGEANRVTVLEQHRWAEPLRAAIARVVAEDLGQLLGTSQASTRDDVIRHPTCRVSLDVRRFETRADSAVDVDILWTVACPPSDRQGQSRVAERIATGGAKLEATVAAYGRALDAVSREIAQAFPAPGAASAGPPSENNR